MGADPRPGAVQLSAHHALLPAFVKQDLQAGVQDLGLVTSALGAGAVLGALALVAAPEVRRPGRLAIAAIVINGALYVVLSFTRFLPFVARRAGVRGHVPRACTMAPDPDDRAAAGAVAHGAGA